MRFNEKQAIEILKEYSPNLNVFNIVLKHSIAVKNLALKLVNENNLDVDLNLIVIGSLLHDIGRFAYPPGFKLSIRHGYFGYILLKRYNYDYALIAKYHVGFGLTKQDIIKQKLDLPLIDLVPKTKEQIVVCFADNLIDYDKVVSLKRVLSKYKKFLDKESFLNVLKRANKMYKSIFKKDIPYYYEI